MGLILAIGPPLVPTLCDHFLIKLKNGPLKEVRVKLVFCRYMDDSYTSEAQSLL